MDRYNIWYNPVTLGVSAPSWLFSFSLLLVVPTTQLSVFDMTVLFWDIYGKILDHADGLLPSC